ncbi:hypothetical protein [Streptomyces sp. NRRL F-5135]|uniref:hypothetical protein n=1 Tax=Streptomyces sp. NRRL F-5135 TaxID=1463858 RepID=UPI000A976DFB|nr:hypothetical protein [Streptomyces sp. NRRL F-5135]
MREVREVREVGEVREVREVGEVREVREACEAHETRQVRRGLIVGGPAGSSAGPPVPPGGILGETFLGGGGRSGSRCTA